MPDSCTVVGVSEVEQCNGIIQTGPQPTPVVARNEISFRHIATKVWRLSISGGRPSCWALPRFLVLFEITGQRNLNSRTKK